MNRGIATAVGVTAVIVIVLGFIALAAIEDGDPGAPSATPTTADISPSPFAESPTVGTSPAGISPTGSPTQPGTATTAPPGTSPGPGTQPSPTSTSEASPDVAMTGPVLSQSALWLGLGPLFMGALAARSLRRAPGK